MYRVSSETRTATALDGTCILQTLLSFWGEVRTVSLPGLGSFVTNKHIALRCVLKDPLSEMGEPKAREAGKPWISLGSYLLLAGSILPMWADFLLFPSFASALPPMAPVSPSAQAFIMLAVLEGFPSLPSNPWFAYLLGPKNQLSCPCMSPFLCCSHDSSQHLVCM